MNSYRILTTLITTILLLTGAVTATAATDLHHQHWEYFWDDFETGSPPANDQWQEFTPNMPPPGRSGREIVWYRLKITKDTPEDTHLFVPGVYQLYQVFYKNKPVLKFGEFTTKSAEKLLGQKFHLIPLPATEQEEWMYFRIYSDFRNIGFNGIPYMGSRYEILEHVIRKDLPGTIAACLFVFIGLFQFFLFRRRNDFKEYLAFGSFAVLFGIHTLARTNLKQVVLDLPVFWKYTEILTVLILPIGLCAFIESTFGPGYKKIVRRMREMCIIISIVASILGFINLAYLELTESLFNILFIPCSAIMFFSILADRNSRKAEINMFAGGMTIMGFTGMIDGMVVGGDIPYLTPIAPWGTVIFLFSFQYVLGSKFARARSQKFELERDLETAAILTTGFMPTPVYSDERFSINVLFRPARQIGGDWYSYTLESNRWLHVHIGDVTGHSTAAALIAAFSKGATDMMYANISNDRRNMVRIDHLHENLNNILSKSSMLNPLMTFFSAVIDLQSGELSYMNSGHTLPIRIGDKTSSLISGKRRGVLGVDGAREFFSTDVIQLQATDSLLIYSDGFLDALKLNSPRGVKKLKEQLSDHAGKNDGNIDSFVISAVDQSTGEVEIADDITAITIRLKLKEQAHKKPGAA